MKKIFTLLLITGISGSLSAQTRENVVGWLDWTNFSTATAEVGITGNANTSVLTTTGTDALVISDADGTGQRAFATGWAGGANTKSWNFSFKSTKYQTLIFSCRMYGTNTPASFLGPRDFKLQYSLNGSSWTDVSGGTLQAGSGNGNFTNLSNISLPAACANQAIVYLRMLMTSNTSVTNTTVNGGQSHIDDILVTGVSTPEAPTDIALSNSALLVPTTGGSISAGTSVGTLSSTDFNAGNTFSYTLVPGSGDNDNNLFSVSGAALSTAASLSSRTYNIRVRSTDNSSLYYEEAMIVNVLQKDAMLSGDRKRISSMGPDGDVTYSASTAAPVYNSVNNEYLLVWSGNSGASPMAANEVEIFGQRMNATTGASVGSMIRISFMGTDGDASATRRRGVNPAVAYSASNNEYFVVWQGDHNTGSLINGEDEIWGQRINAANGTLSGSMVRVSTMGPDGNAAFDAITPDVAWNATSGNYLVVWRADDNTSPLVDNENEVYAQSVDAGGNLSGSRIRVSTMGPDGSALYNASTPAVAWNATANEFMIIWQADDNTAPLVDNEFEIFGQRLSSTGVLTGSRLRISSMGPDGSTLYAASVPDIAWNSTSNEYMAVWRGDDNTAPLVDNEFEVFSQRLGAAGTLQGGRVRVSDMGPDGSTAYNANTPKLAYNSALNEYWVLWQGDDDATSVDNEFEIFMQRLTGTGNETGTNDVRVSYMGPMGNTSYLASIPAIVYNSTSQSAFASWQGDDNTAPLVDNENEIFGQALTMQASLPVTWLSFTASNQNNTAVLLRWSTASEVHAADFVVQKSTDGRLWRNLGTVMATGYANTVSDYSFTDDQPATGKSYYRILQRDRDNRSTYSKTASVAIGENRQLAVFPNPVNTSLTVQLPVSGEATVKVFSHEGKLVKMQQLTAASTTLDVGLLSPGLYHVQVYQQHKTYHQTVVKY